MCRKPEINAILNTFTHGICELFGDRLISVILFGSYARGDFDDDSDIDVMILVDIPREELYKYRRQITRIANMADWDYTTLLSPTITNADEFAKYKNALPFFRNVDTQGVLLV